MSKTLHSILAPIKIWWPLNFYDSTPPGSRKFTHHFFTTLEKLHQFLVYVIEGTEVPLSRWPTHHVRTCNTATASWWEAHYNCMGFFNETNIRTTDLIGHVTMKIIYVRMDGNWLLIKYQTWIIFQSMICVSWRLTILFHCVWIMLDAY